MRTRIRPLFGAVAITLSLSAAGPSAARAQTDAPQVDPNSPAGTEYELPLDRARQEAAPRAGGGSGGGDTGAAPLFGEGVRRERSGETPGTPRRRHSHENTRSPQAGAAPATAAPPTVRAQAPSPDGGGSEILAVGAGASGVLLLGGLAGLLWRRRSASS
jgi:hypothetical protein